MVFYQVLEHCEPESLSRPSSDSQCATRILSPSRPPRSTMRPASESCWRKPDSAPEGSRGLRLRSDPQEAARAQRQGAPGGHRELAGGDLRRGDGVPRGQRAGGDQAGARELLSLDWGTLEGRCDLLGVPEVVLPARLQPAPSVQDEQAQVVLDAVRLLDAGSTRLLQKLAQLGWLQTGEGPGSGRCEPLRRHGGLPASLSLDRGSPRGYAPRRAGAAL